MGCREDLGRFHRRFCRRQLCCRLLRRKPPRLERPGSEEECGIRGVSQELRVMNATRLCPISFPLGATGNKESLVIISICLAANARRARRLWGPCGTEESEACAWKFKKNKAFLGYWRPAPGVGPVIRGLLAFPEGPVGGRSVWLVPPGSSGAAAGLSLRRRDGF